MKTKTFLLLCLFLGIVLTQLSAQKGKNGTGAFVFERVWDGYWQPVYCNDVLVDYLSGTINQHIVFFYKDGILIKAYEHAFGEVQSNKPPYEVFKVSENGKDDVNAETSTWHFNLIGDYGTHYIGAMTWNWITNETTVDRFVCLGCED